MRKTVRCVLICLISHQAAAYPEQTRERLREVADEHDGITRAMCRELSISYCTLLRLFDRLELRAEMRELWLTRRRARKGAGK
jgi:hypothetical protein